MSFYVPACLVLTLSLAFVSSGLAKETNKTALGFVKSIEACVMLFVSSDARASFADFEVVKPLQKTCSSCEGSLGIYVEPMSGTQVTITSKDGRHLEFATHFECGTDRSPGAKTTPELRDALTHWFSQSVDSGIVRLLKTGDRKQFYVCRSDNRGAAIWVGRSKYSKQHALSFQLGSYGGANYYGSGLRQELPC